jgi:hypothetical protein
VPTTTERSTTVPLTPDEAYLADLHEHVDFNNPEWGQQALDLAEQTCETLTGSRAVMTDDAANDTPQTDAAIADSYVDSTLAVIYDRAGDDLNLTAAVLVIGAQHFCPEWSATVEGDAASRGLTVSPSG